MYHDQLRGKRGRDVRKAMAQLHVVLSLPSVSSNEIPYTAIQLRGLRTNVVQAKKVLKEWMKKLAADNDHGNVSISQNLTITGMLFVAEPTIQNMG